jgi:hypothetical protein
MSDIEQGSLALDQPRTKLEIVRHEVQQNPAVFYAGEVSKYHIGGGWTQGVDMIVAPVTPEFDADKLNEFMFGMVKSVKPTQDDIFRSYSGNLSLGKLYYDEEIGLIVREVNTTVIAYDLEAMQAARIVLNPVNPSTEREQLRRRTWLRVYPDITSATAMYQYEAGTSDGTILDTLDISRFSYEIPQPYVEKLRAQYRNPVSRTIGRLISR